MVLLDRYVPTYDVRERHALALDAAPERALAAARALTVREVPIFAVLMSLRGLPALLRGRTAVQLDRPIVDEFQRFGFVLLADEPDELVLGGTGRFWHLDGGLRRIGPDEFAGFAEPGWAKAVLSFRVEARAGRTELSTETRVATTDASARRSFGRYWLLIRPGSVLIRLALLRSIRRRALR
jgi:hypothetical protein